MKINYIKLPSKSNEIIISAVFNAGKIFAPKKYPELPHLVEHMIANKLLQYNYKYEAVVDTEKCTFNIYIPKENPLKKITGFFEMLFGTTKFDEHELNTEKGIIKKELLRNFDRIENQIYELAIRNRFVKETPYSNSQYPKIFTDDISLSMVNDFFEKTFSVKNCLVNIGCNTITKKFQQAISSSTSSPIFREGKKQDKPIPPLFSAFNINQKVANTNSLYLTLDWPSLRVKDSLKSRVSMWMIVDYLINNSSAILYKKLRKEGVIYGCDWQYFTLEKVGAGSINLSTEKNQVEKCVKIILDEIEKIKQAEIQTKIIEKIKKDFVRNNKALKQNNYRFFDSKSYDAYYNDICTDKELHSIFKSIKIDDLASVGKKIFDHHFLNILMIGPKIDAEQIKKLVKKYF